MHKTTCSSDPFQTKLLVNHLEATIDTILHIVNMSLTTMTMIRMFFVMQRYCPYYGADLS